MNAVDGSHEDDLNRDEGWVSIGIDHDTATFAVQSIRRWWQQMGRPAYHQAQALRSTGHASGDIRVGSRPWSRAGMLAR